MIGLGLARQGPIRERAAQAAEAHRSGARRGSTQKNLDRRRVLQSAAERPPGPGPAAAAAAAAEGERRTSPLVVARFFQFSSFYFQQKKENVLNRH